MKEITTEYLLEALSVFKLAPTLFYSPCGRETNLTKDEIEIRTYLVPRQLRISTNEIIFRKLWEITKQNESKWRQDVIFSIIF